MNSLEQPSPRSLEKLLARKIDDSMLDEIAHADYGESVRQHFVALVNVRNGSFVSQRDWEPLEVLELVRHSEPANRIVGGKTVNKSTREHWMRLFCCTVLLKTSAETDYEDIGEESTIRQFVRSARELGGEAIHAALSFIEWLIGRSHRDSPYCPIAFIILGVSSPKTDNNRDGETLIELAFAKSTCPRKPDSNLKLSKDWKNLIQESLIAVPNMPVPIEEFGRCAIA